MTRVTFTGHSGVIIESSDSVIAIDPWLDGCPTCPENLKNPKKLDYIVLTHGHFDHAGDCVRLAKQHNADVIAIYELCALLGAEGISEDKLLGMNKGGTLDLGSFSVTLTHALHSSTFIDSKGQTHYAGEPCGAVIRNSTHSIFHTGDTCLFSDLSLIGRHYRPDLSFIPIGDRFTMGPEEAAEAARLVGSKFIIPIHWGTFPLLTGTPEAFKEALKKRSVEAECIVLEPGNDFKLQ